MFQHQAKVLWNEKISSGCYKIGLTCPERYSVARPGQFIMLRLAGHTDPLLRRPFSIHNLIISEGKTEGFELLYKVVGKATAILARQRPGVMVDILGPLGTGFIIPRAARGIHVVAGGIGVAPLVFLASQLYRNRFDFSNCLVFIGGRTKEDLLCRDDFVRLGLKVATTTDDGSAGNQCLVTHPLAEAVDRNPPDLIVACGPMAMLACVIGIAEKHRVACQVSIETVMACGMGACLGCAVEGRPDRDRYLHACMDGPVFDATDLSFA
ncbi:MAG: dihydroorotate dehydrogenase electron transfer subunit [Desulfobacteraceae bacterium]|jgi:dihydroorotate dehydrogenase electron transfer subunit|nr:dihydroorotate dehydrogenase electron transfer subunit [Desulfobacteraceae bacterium]